MLATARDDASSATVVDAVLAELFPDYSRSRLSAWIKSGDALLDGREVRPRDPVRGGEAVSLSVVMDVQTRSEPEDITLDVLFEDALSVEYVWPGDGGEGLVDGLHRDAVAPDPFLGHEGVQRPHPEGQRLRHAGPGERVRGLAGEVDERHQRVVLVTHVAHHQAFFSAHHFGQPVQLVAGGVAVYRRFRQRLQDDGFQLRDRLPVALPLS